MPDPIDPHGDLVLEVDETGAIPRAVIGGEIDSHSAPQVSERLLTLFDAGATSLVVDLAAVGFIDSSGLRVLTALSRRAGEAGGTMTIANPSPSVTRLLELTGLSDQLPSS